MKIAKLAVAIMIAIMFLAPIPSVMAECEASTSTLTISSGEGSASASAMASSESGSGTAIAIATATASSESAGGTALAIATATASNGGEAWANAIASIMVGTEYHGTATANAHAIAPVGGSAFAYAQAWLAILDSVIHTNANTHALVHTNANTYTSASNGGSASASAVATVEKVVGNGNNGNGNQQEQPKEKPKEEISGGLFIKGKSFQDNANVHAYRIMSGYHNYNLASNENGITKSWDLAMLEWYAKKFSIFPNNGYAPKILIRESNMNINSDGSVNIEYWAWNFDKVPRDARVFVIGDNSNGEKKVFYNEVIHLGIVGGMRKNIRVEPNGAKLSLVLMDVEP